MQSERMSMRLSSNKDILRLLPSQFKDNTTQLINRTLDSLSTIWADAGYDDAECQMLLGDIFIKFQSYCTAEISSENDILTHAKLQVKEKWKVLNNFLKQLGRSSPPPEDDLGNNVADRLAELEKRINDISVEVNQRESVLSHQRQIIDGLIKELGEDPPNESIFSGPAGTPELSDVRLELMKQYTNALQNIKQNRKEEITSIAMDCNKIFVDLVVSEEGTQTICGKDKYSGYDTAIITLAESGEYMFGYHKNDVTNLQSRLKTLITEKDNRKIELAKTGAEIARLWTLLRIPSSERQIFQSSFQANLSMATLARGREELNRLLHIRTQSLGRVIESIRHDILDLWEEIGITTRELQAEEFPLYFEMIESLADSSV